MKWSPLVRAVVAMSVVATVGACAPQPAGDEPIELEVEDISANPTAEVDLTGDKKAARRSTKGGQLPGSFPDGLPIFRPSEIEDLGSTQTGGGFVTFVAEAGATSVRSWYQSELKRSGWEVRASQEGALLVSRDGRSASVLVESLGVGSSIRVQY